MTASDGGWSFLALLRAFFSFLLFSGDTGRAVGWWESVSCRECSKENDRVDEAAVVDNEKDVGKVQDQEKPEENGADKVEEREKISDEASKESKKRKRQTEQAHVESQTIISYSNRFQR